MSDHDPHSHEQKRKDSAAHDRSFYIRFSLVLGSLVVFALVCIWIAREIAPSRTDYSQAVYSSEAIEDRIQPVGQLLTDASQATALAVAESATVAESKPSQAASPPASQGAFNNSMDPELIYQQVCQICHLSGLAGAPIAFDPAQWQSRLAAGIEAVYANAINGVRGMPPRGARPDLSDEQLKRTIDYMITSKN